MFGLGKKRKNFNGAVDTRLNNEYQIVTDSEANPLFPAPLAYLNHLDQQWNNKLNEHEAALVIACMYFCGCAEGDEREEALRVHERILAVSQFGVAHGQVDEAKWELMRGLCEKRYALVGL